MKDNPTEIKLDTIMEIELELMSVALALSKKEGTEDLIEKISKSIERVRSLCPPVNREK